MMNVTEFFESCPPSADGAFGPAVQGCRDDFDFTLAFEDYFFSIVPSAIFLLLAPVRVQQLFSKRQRVHGDTFKYTKVVRQHRHSVSIRCAINKACGHRQFLGFSPFYSSL